MYHVFDKKWPTRSRTFSTAPMVASYLLGRNIDEYAIVKSTVGIDGKYTDKLVTLGNRDVNKIEKELRAA